LANLLRSFGVHNALPVVSVALPIGVSFFTFMGLSYVIDIWRGRLEPAPALDVAVFVSFFPHLVAGPIVRGSELLPQFRIRRDPHDVDYPHAAWLIMRGLFKKVVISSFVASAIVDPVFSAPRSHAGLEILVAIYAYAVQIYADFSGYTDIAIGVALLLGFRFPQNFDAPYAARSLQDFWRRWHMTLSRWLRDYLYIPLGGSRGSRTETVRNIILTMALAGLWHGAGWTFVAWGLFHGVGQAVGFVRRSAGAKASSSAPSRLLVQRVVTFHLVCLGWVLFRADSVHTAWVVLTRLTVAGPAPLVTPVLLAVIAASLAVQFVPAEAGTEVRRWLAGRSVLVQGAAISAALVAITSFGPQGVAPFIYYRF
jgi:alginate O-acetyltransferase complex protein AlgI